MLKVVFLGTPDFASICLEAIINHGVQVVVVVTAPDKKQGRGQKLGFSSVKMMAQKHQLPVLQPTNLKDPEFLEALKSYHPDLGIVVAFRMLPTVVWELPTQGTLNLHASLLPDYRGAAPINWALINGEKKTGVTTFFLKHQIDTGDIVLQDEVLIDPQANAGDLHDELARKGSALLLETIDLIDQGSYERIQQETLISDQCALHEAPKIFKTDCEIDWNNNAQKVYNFIRGLSPYPGAWTTLMNAKGQPHMFKIFEVAQTEIPTKNPGHLHLKNKEDLFIDTQDFALKLITVQMEGKQRMASDSFIRGYDVQTLSIKNKTT